MSRPVAWRVGSSWPAPSLSEKLCLRLSVLVSSEDVIAVAVVRGCCSEASAVELGMVAWVEMVEDV